MRAMATKASDQPQPNQPQPQPAPGSPDPNRPPEQPRPEREGEEMNDAARQALAEQEAARKR